MKPTWRTHDGSVQLYHADCLDVLPTLEAGSVDAIVTDPVWPNCPASMFHGSDNPQKNLNDALTLLSNSVERIVIHLGVDSDPRFLAAVPLYWPFLRACWLRYARPCYKGRLLVSSEIAYLFGKHRNAKGYRVAPSEMVLTQNDKATMRHTKHGDKKGLAARIYSDGRHPTPRQSRMVIWLIKWFVESACLDPFMGSGTTGVACVRMGRKFIGIEIDEKYFAIAVKRIEAELNRFPLLKQPTPYKQMVMKEKTNE